MVVAAVGVAILAGLRGQSPEPASRQAVPDGLGRGSWADARGWP